MAEGQPSAPDAKLDKGKEKPSEWVVVVGRKRGAEDGRRERRGSKEERKTGAAGEFDWGCVSRR